MVKSMDKNLELRRLYSQSFDDSEAFVDYFFENMTTPEKVVSLVRDGKTVSALHLLDRTIFLRGGLFDIPFVVAAATVKELRGMRLLENVMKTAFDRLYSTGKTFVALYPFKHAYYKKYGFVTYTSCVKREIKFKKDDGINILPATSKEMLKIYNRFCFGKQGYIVRQIEDYDELLKRWSVDELISFVVKKSEREAYAVFSPFSKEIEDVLQILSGSQDFEIKIRAQAVKEKIDISS